MVTVAWNPSTLKLSFGPTGKICWNCCGASPVSCPATYTVSFSGISPCPAPYFIPFVTGKSYAIGACCTYSGQSYINGFRHFADIWYSDCWSPLNLNFPTGNGTYQLTGGAGDANFCQYTLYNDNVRIVLTISFYDTYNIASLSLSVAHPVWEGETNFWKGTFSDGKLSSPASMCPELTNDAASVDMPCISSSERFDGIKEGYIGTGGTAKIFPDSFPDWTVNIGYEVGNIVAHLAEKYVCTQAHYSTLANEPGAGVQWSYFWSVSPC